MCDNIALVFEYLSWWLHWLKHDARWWEQAWILLAFWGLCGELNDALVRREKRRQREGR